LVGEFKVPKELPDDWLSGDRLTLNVREDLGLKGQGVPADLRVFLKPSKSKSLYAAYLPAEEDDLRPHQGRTQGGKGKRKVIEASMGTTDPFQAGRAAIEWVKEPPTTSVLHVLSGSSRRQSITTLWRPTGSVGMPVKAASAKPSGTSPAGAGTPA
jgi:hypothetical protein